MAVDSIMFKSAEGLHVEAYKRAPDGSAVIVGVVDPSQSHRAVLTLDEARLLGEALISMAELPI